MKQVIMLVLLMSFTLAANAQLGALKRASQKMQDKLNRKIEQKIDRKVDEKIDEELDEVFDSNKEETVEGKQKKRGLGSLAALGGPPEHVDPNPVTMSFDMESTMIESKGKKKSNESRMTSSFAFEKWKTGMLIQSDNGKEKADIQLVYDLEAKKMTMVSEAEGKPQGIVMWMQSYEMEDEDMEDYMGKIHFEPTGNTKTIDGYFCKEYEFKNEDAEGTVWITKDIDVNLYEAMQFMNFSKKAKGMKNQNNEAAQIFSDGGFWLESDMTTSKGERVISKIKNVRLDNIDKKALNLEGVEIGFDMTDLMNNTGN